MITLPPYCRDPFTYHRRKTRVVNIGDVPLGGEHPIRLQSMTISDTMDTAAAVDETIQLVEAGCELVRLTAPSLNEAENLRYIKAALNRRGVRVPLIADIHFTPNAALKAAEYVEKVRINPGNYADKKKFAEREYTDSEYEAELERIEQRFKPLVLKLKQYGVAMRIGTNHGSLSDRIMNRFGDTPQGMVESALEFVRICRRYDYHDIVLSMKASNPLVMIQAYRLLAARMDEEGMDYPFHLGVTEAGDGVEGQGEIGHRHRRPAGGRHRRHDPCFAHRGRGATSSRRPAPSRRRTTAARRAPRRPTSLSLWEGIGGGGGKSRSAPMNAATRTATIDASATRSASAASPWAAVSRCGSNWRQRRSRHRS